MTAEPVTTTPQQRSMTGPEWLMLLVLSVLWGCSFLFSKVAVAEIPPLRWCSAAWRWRRWRWASSCG